MDQNDNIGIPADANKRKFTGIWIPAEIWQDEELPATAKMLYAEIASFGDRGCWKKSEELMRPLGVKSASFQQLCRLLNERGYITEKRAFGRVIRTTTLGFCSSAQNIHQCKKQADDQAEWQADEHRKKQAVHKEYSKNIVKIKGAEAPADEEKKAEEQPTTYGRDDINEIVDLWEQETGTSIKGDKNERRQVYNLIRKHGAERTKALVRAVGDIRRNGDRFAPQIATPRELTGKYSKLGRLEMWMERKSISRPFGTQEKPLTPCPDYALPPRDLPAYGGAFEVQSDEEREKVARMMAEKRKTLPFMKKKGANNE